MHGIRRTRGIIVFVLAMACLSGVSVPGRADYRGGPAASDWPDVDFLSALARLPDGEVPLGKSLVMISSLVGEELTGVRVDPAAVEGEIDRMAERVRPALGDRSNPRKVVAALNRFLYVEEGFTYDCVAGNPDNYLLDRVISGKRANCLGMTALYLLLAERLSLPLQAVYVPSHCFVRYEDAAARFNIETGEKGAEWEDARYLKEFRITETRPYLRSLGRKEAIGVYLKSIGAAFSRKGREDRALRLYREAEVFSPGLSDLHFNAGVSYHKMGMLDEAITRYRRALALDPDLAVARDNLSVVLAKQGRIEEALSEARNAAALRPRSSVTLANLGAILCAGGMTEEGIREYRRALEVDPGNAKALAGLTKAHFARGEFHEAIVHCDRAIACGWTPDPAMLEALEKYREPSPASLP